MTQNTLTTQQRASSGGKVERAERGCGKRLEKHHKLSSYSKRGLFSQVSNVIYSKTICSFNFANQKMGQSHTKWCLYENARKQKLKFCLILMLNPQCIYQWPTKTGELASHISSLVYRKKRKIRKPATHCYLYICLIFKLLIVSNQQLNTEQCVYTDPLFHVL